MWRSWFARGLFLLLGGTFLYLVVAPDSRPPDMEGALGAAACLALAVATLGLALPRPPAARTLAEAEPATTTVGGRETAGTSLPLPRARRFSRLAYRVAWVAFAVLFAALALPNSEGWEIAVLVVVVLTLVPGLVAAARGVGDPARTGLLVAPEGIALEGYRRRLVAWDDIREATVFRFHFRGVETSSLILYLHRGRGPRLLEWRLPLRAEDAVRLIERLREDPAARARLGDAGGTEAVRRLVEGVG